MEFCKHKSCCYDNKADCGNLKLVSVVTTVFMTCYRYFCAPFSFYGYLMI